MARKKKEEVKPEEDKMEKLDPRPEESEDDIDEEEVNLDLEDRKKDYSGLKKVREQISDIYQAVIRGFEDKSEQNQVCDRAWDMYNCVLNENRLIAGYPKFMSRLSATLSKPVLQGFLIRFFLKTGDTPMWWALEKFLGILSRFLTITSGRPNFVASLYLRLCAKGIVPDNIVYIWTGPNVKDTQ